MAFTLDCANKNLPLSTDVQITINKPQTLIAVDLSLPVVVVSTGDLLHGADRVRYYTDLASVEADWGSSSDAYFAASAFFARTERPTTMAVGQAYDTAQAGYLIGGELGELANFVAISDGSFNVVVDGTPQDVTGLDFTSIVTYPDIISVINGVLIGATASLYNDAQLLITSDTTGATSTLSLLTAVSPSAGTDVSGAGLLNAQSGIVQAGYTPSGLTGELDLIQEALSCSGRFAFGWCLDKTYRTVVLQQEASAWAAGNEGDLKVILGLSTNDILALEAGSTADIGSVLKNTTDPISTFIVYGTVADEYPEMSVLALMLGVDYNAADSTITAKFKDLTDLTNTSVTTTELTVLESKGYNVLTLTGRNARVFREGIMINDDWFIDDYTNLQNFANDIQVAVYNVFLVNKKVPYDNRGIALLHEGIGGVCNIYVENGTIEDDYSITNLPVQQASISDRAARKGVPFTVDVNLSGAIHSVRVIVNAFDAV